LQHCSPSVGYDDAMTAPAPRTPTWLDRFRKGAEAAVETAGHYATAAARTAAPVIASVQEKAARSLPRCRRRRANSVSRRAQH
jgi:hypothetical protein